MDLLQMNEAEIRSIFSDAYADKLVEIKRYYSGFKSFLIKRSIDDREMPARCKSISLRTNFEATSLELHFEFRDNILHEPHNLFYLLDDDLPKETSYY